MFRDRRLRTLRCPHRRRESAVAPVGLALKLYGIAIRSYGWQLDLQSVVGGCCLRARAGDFKPASSSRVTWLINLEDGLGR
jgi:hypothetical protein